MVLHREMRARSVFVVRAACMVLSALLVSSTPARADDPDVVARLVEFGRMSVPDARELGGRVSAALRAEALRTAEPNERIAGRVRAFLTADGEPTPSPNSIRARLFAGLDVQLLTVLFARAEHSAAYCALDFDLAVSACDALISAATRTRAPLYYLPPDTGADLRASLRSDHASRAEADRVAQAVSRVLLSVPRSLESGERATRLLELMGQCPGALTDREAQLRAWHVGPTAGLARCLAVMVAQGRTATEARTELQVVFDLPAAAAQTYLRWAVSGSGERPAGAARSALQWVFQAREHFDSGRYREAATAYELATEADDHDAQAFAGLASSLLRLEDAQGAVSSGEKAVLLAPDNAAFHVLLGHARVAARDRVGAEAAYRQALAIDPNHAEAKAGLDQLNARPRAPGSGAERWRTEARRHYADHDYAHAAAAYERAVATDPGHPGGFAGLGASRLAMQDYVGAVEAYREAVRLAPSESGFRTALARALVRAGDRDSAVRELRVAADLDPSNAAAQAGLVQLGVSVPAASVPAPSSAGQAASTAHPPAVAAPSRDAILAAPSRDAILAAPSRDAILAVLRPLQRGIAACAPSFHGQARFRVEFMGRTGAVRSVALESGPVGTPEGACMEGAIRAVTLPPFRQRSLSIVYPYTL